MEKMIVGLLIYYL